MRKIMKRRFGLILAALFLLAGLIAGCAKKEPVETYSFQVETVGNQGENTQGTAQTEAQEIESETEKGETEAPEEETADILDEAMGALEEQIGEIIGELEEIVEAVDEGDMITVEENGSYSTKEEVALYIHTFGKLPSNFITKKKAEEAGWISSKGNLWKVCPGMSIGGSRFGNYEGQLPEKDGRKYFECDINYGGGKRGAERIVYSNDGLIFYTGDHYETFEQLY